VHQDQVVSANAEVRDELQRTTSAALDRRPGRGRRGYSLRVILQAVIAAWVYNLHSMAELRRELLRSGSVSRPTISS
jgi:hypothetical protein